jgi:hypothetical protein
VSEIFAVKSPTATPIPTRKLFQISSTKRKMGKTSAKSKHAAPEVSTKKNGDGGRTTKPSAKLEKSKIAAKAVVAASSKNGVKKESKVSISRVWLIC